MNDNGRLKGFVLNGGSMFRSIVSGEIRVALVAIGVAMAPRPFVWPDAHERLPPLRGY
jgi:hypothetical protein